MIFKHFLIKFLSQHKIPIYRAKQTLHAIYKEGKSNFKDIIVLPQSVRNLLAENFSIFSFTIERENISQKSRTVKTLFRLHDGKMVEGVLMRFRDGRNSVCVSSQIGCGLKCKFCATGAMGFKRNLSAEEIADQVFYFDCYLKRMHKNHVTHVVFMGMGEPFLNYDAVMDAVRILNDKDLLGIAARHITISTAGIIPGIEKLMHENLQINLAVSLHAPTQALREKLMPIAKTYKLPDLMAALKKYTEKTRRRISYEYVMLKNVNDSEENAAQLAKLVKGQLCHINLIPYNETYLGFQNAGKLRINRFREILESFKIPVTVRVSLGQDIAAACGQLAVDGQPAITCSNPYNLH